MGLTSLAHVDASCPERSPAVVGLRAHRMQIGAAGGHPFSSWLSKYYLCLSEKHFLLVTA